MSGAQIIVVDQNGNRRFALRFDPSLLRRRGAALVFTILIHLLLILLVLLTRSPVQPRKQQDELVTFSVTPGPPDKQAGEKESHEEKQAEQAASAPPPAPVRRPQPPAPTRQVPPPIVTPKTNAPSFIQLSPSDFAAADIGRLPSAGAASGNGTQGDSKMVTGPGEGPGGVQLFEAEWYRRPTDAELAGYMPVNPPREGWGLVACKTIENYHVENCQALGESPMGSGLAKAVRQAAWQFLVRPPRINGRPQIGTWVRIRIDYSQRVVREDGSAPGD